MNTLTRLAQLALTAALATVSFAAAAQAYPDKPIKILVPFPPGGGTDFVSRLVGIKLGELTGWQIVLENRPGAGGNLAIEAASKAPSDGYTFVMGQTDNMMLGPWLYTNLSYDSVKSFAPVVQLSVTPAAIGSASSSALKTPQDLVAQGKTAAGLRWATAGAGTLGHLIGEDFKKRTEINLLQVPYKGASPAVTDVMGGQVDVYIGTLTSLVALMKSGRLTGVAVTTAKRSADFPDIPTLDESVAKGMDFSIWMGMFAPAGTSPTIIAQVNKEMNRVLQSPDIIAKFQAGGVAAAGGTSQAFAEFVKADYAKWGALVKASGIKLTD
ncbi:MAG: LacI family transcriptional regulator [Alcaligenaceae bacterium]|nr:MAG: LacI family transcriptional regulator [Alcaligenaceae bacterium]